MGTGKGQGLKRPLGAFFSSLLGRLGAAQRFGSSRSWTRAGGAVASTAVNGSRIS